MDTMHSDVDVQLNSTPLGFSTLRLHLRPIDVGDEALYCRLYTDAALMRHIAPPMTPEAATRSFRLARKLQSPTQQRWIVCERDALDGIGLVGLIVDKSDADIAEIGVMLLAAGQRAGFGTEAMAGVIDRTFSMMSVRLLWIRQNADNIAVPGMMRKLGFQPMPSSRVGPGERYWQQDRSQWQMARSRTAGLEKSGQTDKLPGSSGDSR